MRHDNFLRRHISQVGLGLFLLSTAVSAAAYEVQPMRHSLTPSDGRISSVITVRNTRSEPLPIEPVFQFRQYDEAGKFSTIDGSQDFVIFPPQALIEPGETQSFRFQYVGDNRSEIESAYTLLVQEVPVDLKSGFTGLRYVYDFGVAVYIEDSDLRSDLEPQTVTRDGNRLSVAMRNNGGSFARLSNDSIRLSQGDKRVDLDGAELGSIIDQSVVSPGATATINIDISQFDFPDGDILIEINERSD